MQKKPVILPFLMFLLQPLLLLAQSGCDLFISSSFDSDCLLTGYNGNRHLLDEDTSGCFLACRGNTVSYTAVCDSAVSYTWNIMGAAIYNLTNQNKTAVVTWGSGETGQIIVTAVTSSNNTCSAEACVQLMESPQIGSATVPAYYFDQNGLKTIEICLGETLELTDMSSAGATPLTGYKWETPAGNFSTPSCAFTVLQTGTFTLLHEIQNECGCKATERIVVRVVEPAHLRLSCYGTVCEGTVAKYHLETPICSQCQWYVEGGSYVTGGSPRDLIVHWGAPVSGYGVIAVDGNFCNACNAQLSVKIPIITDGTEISGPDVICVGDIQQFGLPLWGATDYQWYTSNTNGIQLYNTESPNEILAKFTLPGQYSISAAYECAALECGLFRSVKTITVKDTLRIVSDDDKLCVGSDGIFTTNYGDNVSWKLFGQNGQLIYSTASNALAYTFSKAGQYKVVAFGADYCNEAEFWVTVMDSPPALTTIDGPHATCLNSAILLKGSPTHLRYYLEWKPLCAASPQEGSTVTIHYEDEICDVAVYQVDREYGCRSAAYIHVVDTFQLLPHGLPAITNVCPGDIICFEVPNQSSDVLYEWRMEPVNAATALEDFTLPHVYIRTNHLSDSSSFTVDVILLRKYCGLSEWRDTVQLSVNNLPPPALSYPDIVCQNEVLPFAASALPVPGTSVWSFPNRTLQGDTVSYMFSSTGLHTFTYTYQPDADCDPFTFTGSVYVVANPVVTISRHGDTLSVPAQPNVHYLWTHGNDTLSASSSCLLVGDGVYCCQITSTTPPYCSAIWCYRIGDGPATDSCHTIEFDSALVSCNTAVITATSPANATFTWVIDPDIGSCFTNYSTETTTASFISTGNHYVDARTTVDGQCYTGRKYVTIQRVPEIKLTYDCDSERIVVHDLSQYADSVIPDRTIALNGNYYSTLQSPNLVAYIPAVGFSAGTYTVTMTMTDQGCVCTDSIHYVPKPQITNIENWTNLCAGQPVQLHAFVNGAEGLWLWDYGDGSYAMDGITYHTFSPGGASYDVTLTVHNSLGCTTSLSKNFFIVQYNLDGELLALGMDVCPGTARTIEYNNLQQQPFGYYWYSWYQDATFQYTTVNYPYYPTFETGNYKVTVVDQDDCWLESLRNVGFLTAPTAKITGNTSYCLDDEVKLFGNSGASNTYAWSVTGPQSFNFATANIAFTPSLSGDYLAVLAVTSPDGCVASDSCMFTVHAQPAAPAISSYGNECIHHPPVGVKSANGQSLFWSNGYHSPIAYYYTPGYLTAYYVDDSTGCPSAKANKFIPPAPDYDALLTGCYAKCPEDLPFYMHLNGFYPNYSGNFHWNWHYGNTIDTSGYSIAPSLPVRDIGTYQMRTTYGNNCLSVSPTLSIESTTECLCDSVTVYAKKNCVPYYCDLNFQMYVFIHNTSTTQTLSFDQVTAHGGTILSVATLPVTVAPSSEQVIEVLVKLTDFENGYVEFALTDSQHQCVKRFTEHFDWNECVDNNCQFGGAYANFLSGLSSPHQGSYFHVQLALPVGTTQILDFWSDPPQILAPDYNQTGFVNALLMLNYGQLTQLVNSHGYICFHAIVCVGNHSLCHATYCLHPWDFYTQIPDDFRQLADTIEIDSTAETARNLQIQSDSFPGKPWLAPNPARDEVAVMGIEPEEVAEITVLTMQGRQVASYRNDYRFNVSRLAKASYIVRVITTDGKVHYLKLVRQ